MYVNELYCQHPFDLYEQGNHSYHEVKKLSDGQFIKGGEKSCHFIVISSLIVTLLTQSMQCD